MSWIHANDESVFTFVEFFEFVFGMLHFALMCVE